MSCHQQELLPVCTFGHDLLLVRTWERQQQRQQMSVIGVRAFSLLWAYALGTLV